MNPELSQTAHDQDLIILLRETTAQLHQSLHEHPLLVELLQRASVEVYRKVLRGFLLFYESTEPRLVEAASRLGLDDWYPEPVRTNWLIQDLGILGSSHQNVKSKIITRNSLGLSSIGQLIGCLYVIKGSALGGRSILKELREYAFVDCSNRFFTGNGEQTTQRWRTFQKFANERILDTAERQSASVSACQTFISIRDCLTLSMNLDSVGHPL